MSIATEISRLQTAKANIKSSIEAKGVTVPSATTLDGYSALIDSISTGGSISLQQKTVTPSGTTQTITADTGYDGLSQVTVNPVTLSLGTIRPGVELVQTYTYDKLIKEDEDVTIPSYTTTSTTLIAGAALTPTISLDVANYDYYVVERMLSIPTYSISTKAKGRDEYAINTAFYEIVRCEANTFTALIDSTKYQTAFTTVVAEGTHPRLVYWTSGSAITAYNTAAYGTFQTPAAPTLSGTTLTIKSTNRGIRGHTTYLTSTYFDAITDIRYQYVIKVYRAPKAAYNFDGWGLKQETMDIVRCVDSNTHTLD